MPDVSGNYIYSCGCAKGWNGHNCDGDFDECASNPRRNRGVCTESSTDTTVAFGDFKCRCDGFFEETRASIHTGYIAGPIRAGDVKSFFQDYHSMGGVYECLRSL